METLFTPETMRMVERIVVVLGGVLAIYLGYRLFHIARLEDKGVGKLKSSWIELSVSRVGPGVFFAAFGAYVLGGSLKSPMEISTANAGIQQLARIQTGNGEAQLKQLELLLAKLPTEDQDKTKKILADMRATQRTFRAWLPTMMDKNPIAEFAPLPNLSFEKPSGG